MSFCIIFENLIKKDIIIEVHYAPYIKRTFELYSTGQYSFHTISKKMYDEGFRHPKTGERFPERKFEWILHNPFYIGEFVWGGKTYPGNHLPIISNPWLGKTQQKLSKLTFRNGCCLNTIAILVIS